jgi:hypothetical protein
MLSLIASVRLTETVLYGPSRLAAVPGLKSPRPIISAARAVLARVGPGWRRVGRAWRRRANLQFATERGIRVACAPIDQRRLDLLPRNSARIAFNIVQNIAARWRPIPLCRDDGRRRRRCCGWELCGKSFRCPRNQLQGRARQCRSDRGAKIGPLLCVESRRGVAVFPGRVAIAARPAHPKLAGVGVRCRNCEHNNHSRH